MILTADDFGLSRAVSEGILKAIAEKKISATSCMVLGAQARSDLALLANLRADIDIGLHLTLTHDVPAIPLKRRSGLVTEDGRLLGFRHLAKRAYARSLDAQQLFAEITAQIDLFTEIFGRTPDFIDGHQHAHQLPGVREALLKAIMDRCPKVYVRVAHLPLGWLLGHTAFVEPSIAVENLMLSVPGRALARLLRAQGISCNRFLLGHYAYAAVGNFASFFKLYMQLKPQANDIFLCHPGLHDGRGGSDDPIGATRAETLHFLISEECAQMLIENQVTLNRFGHLPNSGDYSRALC